MASKSKAFSPPPSSPAAEPMSLRTGPEEALIQDRLRRTQRQVKGVDIAAGMLVLGSGVLVWLLAAAVLDQWVIEGGLGFGGRLVVLLAMLAAAGAYFAIYVWPPLARRINPIFAAHTIEQSRPSLKNSLVNFLLLRQKPREVSRPMFEAVTHQAATGLSTVGSDTAVDREHVIRLGYVLTGVVAVFAVYLVLSPKSLLTSSARVLWPWADILAPTRVRITDIQPGDATAFLGQPLAVSAEVDGLGRDEPVVVYYTTADRQSVNEAVPMTLAEGQYRHSCQLPPSNLGLQQDLEYHLAAGDFTSRTYRVEVHVALTVLDSVVQYEYPAYTGLAKRVDQQQANIKAVEGTRVTVTARANMPIARAEIDLDCDGVGGVTMAPADQKATGSFVLRVHPDDPTRPEHESYQILLSDRQGHADLRPIRHRIEVIRDLPPEIELVNPPADQVELAENGAVELRVRAQDPDFALRRVSLTAVRDGRSLPIPALLAKPQPEEPYRGSFEATYRFEPAKLGLKAGDRIEYRAAAEDNKEPVAGRTETAPRRIVITPPRPHEASQAEQQQSGAAPAAKNKPGQPAAKPSQEERAGEQPGKPSKEQTAADKAQGQQPGEQNAQKDSPSSASRKEEGRRQGQEVGESETKQSGRGQKQDQQKPESAESAKQPIDGETNPGDAFQEILKDRNQQQQRQKQPQGKAQSGDKSQGKQPPGEEQSAQSQQGGQEKQSSSPGEKQQANQPSGAQLGNQAGGAQGNKQSGDKQPSGQKQPSESEDAQGGAGEKSSAEAGKDKEQGEAGAGKPSGEKQSTGSPSPLVDSQSREKRLAERAESQPGKQETPKSPSISPKQSDSQGENAGERSGGGEEGGGQHAKQPGAGSAGSNTAAEQGASQANQPGEGQTGAQGGDRVASERPTGGAQTQQAGRGSKTQPKSGDQGATAKAERQPEQGEGSAGRPGDGAIPPGATPRGQTSTGAGEQSRVSPVGGGKPGPQGQTSTPPPVVDQQADAANLEYTRKQTVLALEYLKDQLAKEKPGVLDRLGWSHEDAERFLQTWRQMQRAAAQEGLQGDAAKRQLDDALQSLGLRPQGAELRGGDTEAEDLQNLRDAGRYEPPAEWAEQFRAYTKGVSSKQ